MDQHADRVDHSAVRPARMAEPQTRHANAPGQVLLPEHSAAGPVFPTHLRATQIAALQRLVGNRATTGYISEHRHPPPSSAVFVQRIAEDPVAIRAKWVEDVQLFLDEGKLGGQILDFDRLRDRTIQNKWFADSEWALMVMGVAQQLEAKARDGVAVPNDAFMNIMVRQIDVKYRPELTDVQKQLKKQKVRSAATPTRARKNQLKAIWKDPA